MKYFDNIVNPVAEARINDGYSLKRLGTRLGMSAQYISRAEHGTYSDLNKELVDYTADVLGTTPVAMMDRYRNFQSETRRRTARELKPKKLMRGNSLKPGHELFTNWREVYWTSPMAFSNAFCVHPDVVTSYEDGNRTSIPGQVLSALRQVRLIEENWSEKPIPGQRISPFGPVAKRQIDSHLNRGEVNEVSESGLNRRSELVIPIPGQRCSEPF